MQVVGIKNGWEQQLVCDFQVFDWFVVSMIKKKIRKFPLVFPHTVYTRKTFLSFAFFFRFVFFVF